MFETWYKMSSMLQSGRNIEPIITHHFDIDDFQPAFELPINAETTYKERCLQRDEWLWAASALPRGIRAIRQGDP